LIAGNAPTCSRRTPIGIAEARIDQLRREARVDASVFASYMRMNAGFPERPER
jgi:hypothetical protein